MDSSPTLTLNPEAVLDHALGLLASASIEQLRDERFLTQLICDAGLSDGLLREHRWLPEELWRYAGRGLFMWQMPIQLAPYLIALSHREIDSYIELGTSHGGTFIFTVEYLQRFTPIRRAVAVDKFFGPTIQAYAKRNTAVELWEMGTESLDFDMKLGFQPKPFKYALIDATHEHLYVRSDFLSLHFRRIDIIGLHDIENCRCTPVKYFWTEVKGFCADVYSSHEFIAQYPHQVETNEPGMGLGFLERRFY